MFAAPFVMFAVRFGSDVSGVANSDTISLIPSAVSFSVDCAGSVWTSATVAVRSLATTAAATASASAFGSRVVLELEVRVSGRRQQVRGPGQDLLDELRAVEPEHQGGVLCREARH